MSTEGLRSGGGKCQWVVTYQSDAEGEKINGGDTGTANGGAKKTKHGLERKMGVVKEKIH